jgi:CheY-like chemotaxis protein
MKVIVVEDAAEVRELLTLALEENGFAVTGCAAADQAFEAVVRERPLLVITDLMLGASSGLDLISRLRSDLAQPPPIIACSGFPSFEDEALRRGAKAFVPKPFEMATLLSSVQTVLARRRLGAEEHEAAARGSRALRERAVAAAREMLRRVGVRRPDLHRRASWTASFLPRYFGFGEAFYTLLETAQLEVGASSNGGRWPLGSSLDATLCHDIVETNSALLVPDLGILGSSVAQMHGGRVRFFAGVPVSKGAVAIGAICLSDDQPRRMSAADFSLLVSFAQHASKWAMDAEAGPAPMWGTSGLLARDGLCAVLASELMDAEHATESLRLFVFVGERPSFSARTRIAASELGDGRYAILFAQPEPTQSLALIHEVSSQRGFRAGSVVDLQRGAFRVDAAQLLRTAESALDLALQASPGAIKHVVIRLEPFVAEPQP